MKYYKLRTDYNPKISGKANGGCAVELKDKQSFGSIEDKYLWKDYCTQNRINMNNHSSCENYIPFDYQLLKAPLRCFLTGKRVKELDFMTFAPYIHGIQFLVSEKAYNVIKRYRLQTHNAIPVQIDTLKQTYYLLGFPIVGFSYFDFSCSLFYNYCSKSKEQIANEETYSNLFKEGCVDTVLIKLKSKFEVDIIHTPGASYFSAELLSDLKKENVTGYIQYDERLDN